MNDRYRGTNRWWDAPYVFWAVLGIGLLVLIGMLLLPRIMPDDPAEREARSAQIEAQALVAEGKQDRDQAAAKSKRADLMN